MTENSHVYQTQPVDGAQEPPKRLVRRKDDAMIAGVCAGLARYLGVDPMIIRVAVVVGTILGFGSLIIAYVVAWILMPQEL